MLRTSVKRGECCLTYTKIGRESGLPYAAPFRLTSIFNRLIF